VGYCPVAKLPAAEVVSGDEAMSMDLQQKRPGVAVRIFAYCVLALSTMVVLAWPFVLMMSAFIFDAPIRSKADETGRYAMLFYLLSYPLGYLVGIAYIIARRTGQPKGQVWWTKWGVFLFLLPIIQLGLPVLILTLASIVHTGKVVKPGAALASGSRIGAAAPSRELKDHDTMIDAGKEYRLCQML
jgi:hypothetical protein